MEQFIHLVGEMSPYLLLGFFLAGLMHAFIPGRFYARYLSAGNFRSVINAALFGIPLPLCSCGVIPTAMSLRREGASKGAVVSFLIATPQTGIDSIIATYGLMGLPFAIVRPVAALVTAVFGGAAAIGKEEKAAVSCSHATEDERPHGFVNRIVEALRYGYVHMMEDIGKWLVIGLVVAALITICIPTEWFSVFQDNTFASMLLVLCIAVPMYVCATGSIPIAVALMMKGLTPGAALVLLMAGPACNIASMLVVRKVLGTRTLVTYILSIVAGAVLFGSIVDWMQFHGAVDFLGNLTMGDACCCTEVSWFSWVCTAVLAALLVNALVIRRFISHDDDHCCCHDDDCCSQGHEGKTENSSNMKTYHIEGMNCNHCRMSAEKAIQAVPGVTSASIDLQKKEAYVEGTASPEAVCKAVEEVGFTCTL
ncbi:MAG: permease [Bacteroidales bacterium]|nr:permease [Candidatus Cryptobacteroides onthequi]